MEKLLFSEEQQFTQWWFRAIMILSLLSVFIPFVYGLYTKFYPEVTDEPMDTAGLIVTGISTLLMIVLVYVLLVYAKLKTKITNRSLMVSFPPFIRKWKEFHPSEIEAWTVRDFNPVREYGGYGIKRSLRYGMSYTVSGKTGLQIMLKNRKRILIGTQKRQAIEYAMRKLTGDKNSG